MVKILYAPLRKKYYSEKKKEEKKCVFCNPDKKLVVFEGNTAYIIANKYPYVVGHLMVIPKRHITKIEELNKDEDKDVMLLIKRAIKFLRNTFNPDGFNVGLNEGNYSGGSQEHLHFHVLPRYKQDTGFLQTIANTTISALTPEETVKKIKEKNQLK